MPKVDRDRFIESIYHVVIYGNTARSFNSVLLSIGDRINENERMIVRYSIQWNVMLMTISLIDELNKYFFKYKPSDYETKNKIDSYKHIIEPILTQMSKWADIRKFRNNVLAHNFRIDSDGFKSVHLSNKLSNYNIPESPIDLVTLFKYLDAITKIGGEIFAVEYEEALAIVDSFGDKQRIPQIEEDELQKVNLVLLEVNKRINNYNLK